MIKTYLPLVETVSFKSRTYLIEVVEESGGKEVLARCPDLYGVSVKGKDVDDALEKWSSVSRTQLNICTND